jgi:threonine/homoserine/homoserine lactone efflux protein
MNITLQMILLGLIFMLEALIMFSALALLADKLATYLMSERFWRVTKYIKIGVFCVLGLFLIFSNK